MTWTKDSIYHDENLDERYQRLYDERLQIVHQKEHTSSSLQDSHDHIIYQAVCLALKKTESEWGSPPAHFAFFLMGSGGRLEQSFWSDQDHGIVFDSRNDEDGEYFLHLGSEIVYALEQVGYERCEGKVMASNPRWCRSFASWEKQIRSWLREDKWETLRHTLTFIDARSLCGEQTLVDRLKKVLFEEVQKDPRLLTRLTENTGRLKKGIGVFNQLLVETKGRHSGKFDVKQVALFPYVNGLRLLAIEQQILASSTIERYEKLPSSLNHIKKTKESFIQLLEQRIIWHKETKHYEDIHHLNVKELSQDERKQLKNWVKEGHQLYRDIERLYKKGESKWS